jgi:hypothetical protein
MRYRLAADAVLLFHLAFILFVVLGAVLAARRRWLMLLHLPVAAWGFLVEFSGRGCPLTDLENALRIRAGQGGYGGGFLEHYLLWLIYPAGLTRNAQLVLAALVVAINLALYGWLLGPGRGRRRRA